VFHTVTVTPETKQQAQQLLNTPNLYQYWLSKIAVDYQGGRYLKTASEHSKKICFAKWKHRFQTIIEAENGAIIL
jgi:hypothetical protein